MRKNLLDLSGKIDNIILGAIETIDNIADSQSVPFFIIGAAARDLALIIRSYTDAGNVERILDMESDLLESEDFDYISVGARLLGRDIAVILASNTKEVVLEILNKETGKQVDYWDSLF